MEVQPSSVPAIAPTNAYGVYVLTGGQIFHLELVTGSKFCAEVAANTHTMFGERAIVVGPWKKFPGWLEA